ncbi:MAG TPA: hypothetical protein VN200_10225 [Rhodoglobus sp.]|nr:hypothetical protein [Rhodoglobus sp.]
MELSAALARMGGFAKRSELVGLGVDAGEIELAAWYGRRLIRVRKGWYAHPHEDEDVLRAWRVGGRLTCASALAFHAGAVRHPVLHLEVRASSTRLRDPDVRRRRLSADSAVVVHWTRHPGPGDRRAVSLEHAERVAAVCGTRGVPVRPQAAASSSASRIV